MEEAKNEPNNRVDVLYVVLAIIVGSFILIAGFYLLIDLTGKNQRAAVGTVGTNEATEPLPFDPFKNIHLEARAVYVWDINAEKVLFSRNDTVSLPLASLTKLMTALTAVASLPESTVVTVRSDHLKMEGDTGLKPAEQWTLKNLLDLTLVSSSNDGAAAIASIFFDDRNQAEQSGTPPVFIEKMNTLARSLKFESMRFNNETGLDLSEKEAGAYGSARDVSRLMTHLLIEYPEILEPTKYPALEISSLNEITHVVRNTNSIVDKIPGLLASKTGWSDLAGGNLAVIIDSGLGNPIAITVLGSTYERRFDDTLMLVDAVRKLVAHEIEIE